MIEPESPPEHVEVTQRWTEHQPDDDFVTDVSPVGSQQQQQQGAEEDEEQPLGERTHSMFFEAGTHQQHVKPFQPPRTTQIGRCNSNNQKETTTFFYPPPGQ